MTDVDGSRQCWFQVEPKYTATRTRKPWLGGKVFWCGGVGRSVALNWDTAMQAAVDMGKGIGDGVFVATGYYCTGRRNEPMDRVEREAVGERIIGQQWE
jgi:hypothetical protein